MNWVTSLGDCAASQELRGENVIGTGEERWATVCSLIATARLNEVEPYAYLTGTCNSRCDPPQTDHVEGLRESIDLVFIAAARKLQQLLFEVLEPGRVVWQMHVSRRNPQQLRGGPLLLTTLRIRGLEAPLPFLLTRPRACGRSWPR